MRRATEGRPSSAYSPSFRQRPSLDPSYSSRHLVSARVSKLFATTCLLLLGLILFLGLPFLQSLSKTIRDCNASRSSIEEKNHAQHNTPVNNAQKGDGVRSVASSSSKLSVDPNSSFQASPPRFILYRLIGNNMPPLQCPSQLLWNTEYALAHESPSLPGCSKRWVLNQIVNATERALLIDLLLSHGFKMGEDILVRWLNVSKVSSLPGEYWADAVTAQNEARNEAIAAGIQSGARWILPFDGNHFVTDEAWAAIVRSADEAEEKGLKYFKIPVHRLHALQTPSLLSSSSSFSSLLPHLPFQIESQLAFRADAAERFKEGMVYGMRNKLELLERVCGSAKTPLSKPSPCGCPDLGVEGQLQKSDPKIATKCGYSVRLWFFPCNGTDAQRVFKDGKYRQHIRTQARREMLARIRKIVKDPRLLQA